MPSSSRRRAAREHISYILKSAEAKFTESWSWPVAGDIALYPVIKRTRGELHIIYVNTSCQSNINEAPVITRHNRHQAWRMPDNVAK